MIGTSVMRELSGIDLVQINCGKYQVRAFFYNQRYFSTQPQCCLTFSWIELQMLLRCCLIHITIIILRHILYSVYLCPCLGVGLFILFFCALLFIFSLFFISVTHITSLKETHLSFVYFLKFCVFFIFWMIKWIKKANNFQIVKIQPQGVA